MTELTYKDEDNNDVFTSQYLKNKKTCCKSTCLHCPYGYTLEKCGLTFSPVTKESLERANQIISPEEQEGFSVASSLLASAYGAPKKKTLITERTYAHYFFIHLKGRECGVVKKGIMQFSQIYLNEYFKDQGLELALVNSFYEWT